MPPSDFAKSRAPPARDAVASATAWPIAAPIAPQHRSRDIASQSLPLVVASARPPSCYMRGFSRAIAASLCSACCLRGLLCPAIAPRVKTIRAFADHLIAPKRGDGAARFQDACGPLPRSFGPAAGSSAKSRCGVAPSAAELRRAGPEHGNAGILRTVLPPPIHFALCFLVVESPDAVAPLTLQSGCGGRRRLASYLRLQGGVGAVAAN